MKKIILLTLALFFAGCAHIPREAPILSIEIGEMITVSRTIHLGLLDEYTSVRRQRADEFMENVWIPRFIQNFVKKIDLEKEICGNIESLESAMVLQDFVSAASKQVIWKRVELMKVVDAIDLTLRRAINSHYENLTNANNALTGNLKSFHENQQFRDEIVKKLKGGKLENLYENLNEQYEELLN